MSKKSPRRTGRGIFLPFFFLPGECTLVERIMKEASRRDEIYPLKWKGAAGMKNTL